MKKFFYGWYIVIFGMLGNALQGGLIFWSMGIYTSTFEDQFQEPRARINLIESFLTVTVNLLSPLLGWWVDRKSARHLVTLGVASLGVGLIVISQAGGLLSVWVVYATLIPLGVLSIGVLPSSALISRWFRKRRGLGLGLSTTGSSIGGALMPPLLTFMFMAWGWRTALFTTGSVVLCLTPFFYRFLVNHPKDIGLEPEEEKAASSQSLAALDEVDWRIRDLLRCPTLWWQTLISGSLLAVSLGLLANLSLHAKDLGVVGQKMAVMYSIISFCSFFGKIGFGWLMDQVGIKRSGALTIALLLVALGMLWAFPSYPGLIAASLFVGLGFGGVTPLWINLPARSFGAGSVGRALGLMNPLHIPLTAPSAPLAGYISDTTGSYELVWLVYAGFCSLSAVGLFFMQQPKQPARKFNPAG
jgi:sugar phosphate permease